MKQFYTCLFLLSLSFAVAQTPDTSKSSEVILPVKEYPYLFGQIEFGSLSNSLSVIELSNFVSQDYLDQKEKEELLGSIPKSLRFAYTRAIKFAYYEPGYDIFGAYKKGWGIGIRNTYYNSASMSKELLNLIFYGNKPYAGTTVDIEKSKFESWYFSSIDYSFDVMLDTLLPLNITVSLHSGHDHNYYGVSKASIYTDPQGAFLDLDLDYKIRDKDGSTNPVAGFGASVGASIDLPVSKKSNLHLQVTDLGVMWWNNGNVTNADSTFRFQGIYFSNIFDLSDSLRNYASDEYKSSFYYSDSRDYYRMMPFGISAQYSVHPEKRPRLKEVFVGANYRYLAGYYPQLRGGAVFKTGHKQSLTATATVGGYTWAGLDVAYDFNIGYDWKFRMAIHNINGLIIPVMSGGAIGTLAINYRL